MENRNAQVTENRIAQGMESGNAHLKLYISLERNIKFKRSIYDKENNVQRNHEIKTKRKLKNFCFQRTWDIKTISNKILEYVRN